MLQINWININERDLWFVLKSKHAYKKERKKVKLKLNHFVVVVVSAGVSLWLSAREYRYVSLAVGQLL